GIYIAVMYQKIPDVIPTHFGLWGQPDSWGSKTSLLFLYGVSVVMAVIEQWALHAAVKNSVKTGAGSMMNRDTLAVTGPFLALIFGWCSVGTIWLGRLGKYFFFVVLGFVAALFVFIFIRQRQEQRRAQESGRIRVQREEEVYRTEKRDDTLGIPDMKFQGKVDLWAWALLIFVNVLVLWSVIPAAGGEKEEIASVITALIVLVLVDLLMVPIYFRNYIYLGEQELLIVFGFIKKRTLSARHREVRLGQSDSTSDSRTARGTLPHAVPPASIGPCPSHRACSARSLPVAARPASSTRTSTSWPSWICAR